MNLWILFDPAILIPLIGLMGISTALIASTTQSLLLSQLVYFGVGIFLYIFFSTVDYRIWRKFTQIFYILSLLFLSASFFGGSIRGSNRWIDLGIFHIQPSELIKPFIMLTIADLISRINFGNTRSFLVRCLFIIPVLFLIFKQPDLGNVLVYLFTFIVMEYAGGLQLQIMVIGSAIFGILIPLFWSALKEYQKGRIMSFLSPYADPEGTGYNSLQAVIAIGSGQLMGLGLGRGTQSHLLFLPEYHTDFVYASLGEELGFIGGAFVIIFYLILLARLLYIATSIEDRFGKMICIGTFAQLFIQVFINIGMNLRILPITGITLPFVSYGGSSILSSFITLGLVISVHRLHKRSGSLLVIK